MDNVKNPCKLVVFLSRNRGNLEKINAYTDEYSRRTGCCFIMAAQQKSLGKNASHVVLLMMYKGLVSRWKQALYLSPNELTCLLTIYYLIIIALSNNIDK